MILKTFYILLVLKITLVFCKISNLLSKNVPSLEEIKKVVLENGGAYEFIDEVQNSHIITLDQIIKLENYFDPSKNDINDFFLFTREYQNGKEYERLNPDNVTNIEKSHFKARKTYFIIHGFLSDGLLPWVLDLKDKYLKKEDCNVISVNWRAGENSWVVWYVVEYSLVFKKVPFVGNGTANLIVTLMTHKGLSLESVHCTGHSLGAHVCGFAGKALKGQMKRITGLDPAGPYYENVNPASRLDRSDASYVDIIHTNACHSDLILFSLDCYGLNETIGDSDFWPNGGSYQPACPRGFICNHDMAIEYYSYSFDFTTQTTHFLARPCEDWNNFESGNCSCGMKPQYMGYNVNTELDGEFYLWTLNHSPYAEEDSQCSLYDELLDTLINVAHYSFVTCGSVIGTLLLLFVMKRIKRRDSSQKEEKVLLNNNNNNNNNNKNYTLTEEKLLHFNPIWIHPNQV